MVNIIVLILQIIFFVVMYKKFHNLSCDLEGQMWSLRNVVRQLEQSYRNEISDGK